MGLILYISTCNLYAEGTKQIQPTPLSHGRMQLMPYVSDFAIFDATQEHRLHITICNPGEKIYYGFGFVRDYDGTVQGDVIYRIKNPNGVVVAGPATIPTSGAGFIPNYNQAFNGPNVVNMLGYNALLHTPTMQGDYYIEFSFTQPYGYNRKIFDYFDVTVVSANNEVKNGRLWSKNWQLTTNPQSGSSNPYLDGYDGIMYIYSDDGVVTSVNLNNMQPFVFNISANQTGCFNTGNFYQDRKSVDGNYTYSQYKIFLNNPDINCFPTGFFGSITAPTTITGCPGQFCVNVTVDKPGTVEILLNLNGVPGYQPNSTDVLFSVNVVAGVNCIPWSGLDGLGAVLPSGIQIPVEVNYFNGLTHLPLYDVEANTHGYIVQIVRPPSPNPQPRLFWDDTNITGGSSNLNGCINPAGCHQWAIGSCLVQPVPQFCSLGDMSTINTWWYAHSIKDTAQVNFEYPLANANIYTPPGDNDTLLCAYNTSIQLNGGVQFATSGQWNGGGGQFNPSNNSLNPIYMFSQTEIDNGFVTLILNTVGGSCATVADTMHITLVVPNLTVSNDANICRGDAVALIASGMTTYAWTPATGLSIANIPNPMASPQNHITYTVTASDVNGCTASAQVAVNVIEKPDVDFIAAPLAGCKPLKVNFLPMSSFQLATYAWNFGDPASSSANNSALQEPIHQYNNPGTYSVSLNVTSVEGCHNSITQNQIITVYPQPQAYFTFNPREGDSNNMLFSFSDQSVDAVSWNWNFGDIDAGADNFSTIQHPQHLYSQTGFYDVWLLVESPFGCIDSTAHHVIIRGEYTIYAPNAFTPNGDGHNEFFMPEGTEINNNAFILYIYNRWGELVFVTDDVNKPWDGTVMNTRNPAPQDVYVWIFWQENYIIGRQKYFGSVTLLR